MDRIDIAQVMTHDVRTCTPNDCLDFAVQTMWERDIGALPVVDEAGQVIGMVTDRDACMAAYTQSQPLGCLPVRLAMSNHIVTCRPYDTIVAVARTMAKHKVHRVPVVDDAQRPIGIVSINDLALAMVNGGDIKATEVAATLAAICEHRAPMASAAV